MARLSGKIFAGVSLYIVVGVQSSGRILLVVRNGRQHNTTALVLRRERKTNQQTVAPKLIKYICQGRGKKLAASECERRRGGRISE